MGERSNRTGSAVAKGLWPAIVGLTVWVLADPLAVSAQLLQGIPKSPIETMAGSDERLPEGVYFMPWFATGVVYDDNVLFSTRDRRQDDVFLRATPGLQASYQSTPLSVIGNYRFDSELYSRLSNLSAVQQRQFATLEFRGRPSTDWTLNNVLGFAQTRTPFELNFLTSAQVARIKTERYFANPRAEYRSDPYTSFRGDYGFSKDIFGGEIEINSHIINLGAERRVGAHDDIGTGYVGRHFTFSVAADRPLTGFLGGDPDPVTSHAFVMTWGHDFAADTRLDVRAGPRITNGKLDDRPEAFVGLRRRIPGGEVTLAYTSALTTVIGTVGGTSTDNVLVTATYSPIKHLTLTLSPSAAWIRADTFTATVYTAYVEAAYQFNKYVTAKGSAFFSYQESDFNPVGGGAAQTFIIPRNVYWLRVEFTYPSRWE